MSTSTYAAWVSWLEAFRRGEDPATDRLPRVGPELGSYVEARLLDRVAAAFGERVRQWQTALGARIVAAPPESARDAQEILADATRRLEPLVRLAASPLLPRSLGSSLHAALVEVREGARTALDDARRRHAEAVGEALAAAHGADRVGAAVVAPRPAGTPGVPNPRAAGTPHGTGAEAVRPARVVSRA